jgi:hypothetical protein
MARFNDVGVDELHNLLENLQSLQYSLVHMVPVETRLETKTKPFGLETPLTKQPHYSTTLLARGYRKMEPKPGLGIVERGD